MFITIKYNNRVKDSTKVITSPPRAYRVSLVYILMKFPIVLLREDLTIAVLYA